MKGIISIIILLLCLNVNCQNINKKYSKELSFTFLGIKKNIYSKKCIILVDSSKYNFIKLFYNYNFRCKVIKSGFFLIKNNKIYFKDKWHRRLKIMEDNRLMQCNWIIFKIYYTPFGQDKMQVETSP